MDQFQYEALVAYMAKRAEGEGQMPERARAWSCLRDALASEPPTTPGARVARVREVIALCENLGAHFALIEIVGASDGISQRNGLVMSGSYYALSLMLAVVEAKLTIEEIAG